MTHPMNFKTVYSTETNVSKAVAQIKEQLKGFEARMILFFASSHYHPESISGEMHAAFRQTTVFGCSTSGEITSGQMLDNSLVAMAFSDKVIGDLHVAVATSIQEDAAAVSKTFTSFEKHFNRSMNDLAPDQYVGLVLTDGMSGCEENINDQIGNLTNVTFIGGSAGDDLRFQRTYVYAHGKAHTNAALLVLLKPLVKFGFLKTQSFQPTDKMLKVTKLNEARREIIEFDHQPATVAYAQALGVPVGELPDHLFKNPLGLMFDEQNPFVRSPMRTENDSILFYCSMKQDMELTLLQSTDIVSDTAQALDKARKEMGGISAIINFNCILRTLDLKQQDLTQQYGQLFKDVPTVGLSTYGENYIGFINQTATMLLFKE